MSRQKQKRKSTFQTIYGLGSDLLHSQAVLTIKEKLFGSTPELFTIQAKVAKLKKGLANSEETVKEMGEIRKETLSIMEASKRTVGATPSTMGTILTSVRLEEIYDRVGVVESRLNATLNPPLATELKDTPLTRRISQIITPQYPKKPNLSQHEVHDQNIERNREEIIILKRRKTWLKGRLETGLSRKISSSTKEKLSQTEIIIETKELRIMRLNKKKVRLDDENKTFEFRNENARNRHIKSITGYAMAISKISEQISKLASKEQASAEKRVIRRTKNISRDSIILKELLWEKRASDITKALALSAMILIPTALISNKTFTVARDVYCRSRDTVNFEPEEILYGKGLKYHIDRDIILGFDGPHLVMKLKIMYVPPFPFGVRSPEKIPIIIPTQLDGMPSKALLVPMFVDRYGSNRVKARFIPIRGSFEDFDLTTLPKNIKAIHIPYTKSPVCRPGTKRCIGLRRIEFHKGKPIEVGDLIVELIPKPKNRKSSRIWHLCKN